MKLMRRKYQTEDDFWAIRRFLREVFMLHDRREVGWPVYRWDYWRWHVNENIFRFDLSAAVFLWQTGDGRLAAVLHPDGPGEAFLQVHPAWRSAELEVALMSVAETQFAVTQADGCQRLVIWAHQGDALRQNLLQRRGYVKGDHPEFQRRRCLDVPIPAFQMSVDAPEHLRGARRCRSGALSGRHPGVQPLHRQVPHQQHPG